MKTLTQGNDGGILQPWLPDEKHSVQGSLLFGVLGATAVAVEATSLGLRPGVPDQSPFLLQNSTPAPPRPSAPSPTLFRFYAGMSAPDT